MTLSIGISDKDGVTQVAMKRLDTGCPEDNNMANNGVCDLLEPAVYNAVRAAVAAKVVGKATVIWDEQKIEIK